MPNRLASSISPYLQQHAENPVDWYEWGDEAFAEARRRDVPLLISVGYAACHWCHVMAHESFEDPAIAEQINARFVAVKVDREERPDVDAVYMTATQAMTGSGGWPMTVFASPDGSPFHCGTYYPPRPTMGMPSFREVLTAVDDAWTQRRAAVITNADQIRAALAEMGRPTRAGGAPAERDPAAPDPAERDPAEPEPADLALRELARSFDARHGGFGGAPKFPPSMVLEWLLRHDARVGSPDAAAMAGTTLEAMARGGIYDQLGGGFARYSVDAGWVVPHFEKMLYDNALLLRVYAHHWRASGSATARRVATETADWMLRELRTAEGGFASALDADSPTPDDGPREGAFYVWTPDQLVAVLGPDDGAWAAGVWGVTSAGTFEAGTSVLQLAQDPDPQRYASVRALAAAARELRPRPTRDDKVVAAWNGLAVAALADAGALLGRPDWVEAAVATAELLTRHMVQGRMVRVSRDGVLGSAPGVLEDYADVAEGLLALHQATGEDRWLARAGVLLDHLERFADRDAFFDTATDQSDPVLDRIRRPREIADGPCPAGQPAAAGALLTYGAVTGSDRHRKAAARALVEPLTLAARAPRAAGWALAVAEALADGPQEVTVVGDGPDAQRLREVARQSTAPGAVLAWGAPPLVDGPPRVDLRPLVDGRPAAYVCRGSVCEPPTTDPDELAEQLGRRTRAGRRLIRNPTEEYS